MPRHPTPPEALSRIRTAVDTHSIDRLAATARVGTATVLRAAAGAGVMRASLDALLAAAEILDRGAPSQPRAAQ